MPRLEEIRVYPLKSGSGISLPGADLDRFGLRWDRRWMLVDRDGRFLSQRTHPEMAHLRVSFLGGEPGEEGIRVEWPGMDPLDVRPPEEGARMTVRVWDAEGVGVLHPEKESAWFSRALGREVRLLFVPEDGDRRTSGRYLDPRAVSFADAYPLLLISTASLEELNRRLERPVTMERFRPNLVVSGTGPHQEDRWREVRIGGVVFDGPKPCPRCTLVTVDPETGERGEEPLATLAGYRRSAEGIWFGQNLAHRSSGRLAVGDSVEVLREEDPVLGPDVPVAETKPSAEE